MEKKDKATLERTIRAATILAKYDTNTAVAKELGITKQSYNQKLKGVNKFTEEEKAKLAKITEKPISELFAS